MPNIVPMNRAGALTRRDPQRLALFKKTVGKHLTPAELEHAVEYCEIYGANGLVGDIFFFVYDANDPEKRRMVPVLSIGMYRKIAARSKDYRPDEKPARFTYDDTLIGPANPKGIVDCELTVYRYSHGDWFPITERLRWDERAPLVEEGEGGFEWQEIPGQVWPEGHKRAGQPKMRKVPVGEVVVKLDPTKKNWRQMGETMLSKCCEASAIRKGWPNETAGSYVEGELDQAHTIELTATEIIEDAEREDRTAKIGGRNLILVDWADSNPLEAVPAGQFHDRVMAFIEKHMLPDQEEAAHVLTWAKKNQESLRQYWSIEKDGALKIKQALEDVEAFHKAAPQ